MLPSSLPPGTLFANTRKFLSFILSIFIVFQKLFFILFQVLSLSMHVEFRNVGLDEMSYMTTCCHVPHYYITLFISY